VEQHPRVVRQALVGLGVFADDLEVHYSTSEVPRVGKDFVADTPSA
jgi:hypothetical protein